MTSPIRVLKQIVAPTGRHRAKGVLLLPDAPLGSTAEPVAHVVLDEGELQQLLDADEITANECAPCPSCVRSTFHAMNRDGSRRCWTCGTVTADGEPS